MRDHIFLLRVHNLPFCASLQTVVFSKQQGCLTKLRPSRDLYRIITPTTSTNTSLTAMLSGAKRAKMFYKCSAMRFYVYAKNTYDVCGAEEAPLKRA